MNLRRAFLLGIVAACLYALPSEAQQPDARKFVDSIYSMYSTPNAPGPRLTTRAELDRYFTPSLATLIDRDDQQAKKKNEVPLLNGDPFLDSQEWDIKGVAIDIQDRSKSRAVATVKFTNYGEAREVRLDLRRMAPGWRIDDVHWREGSLRGLYRKR